jgi:hypothetical protein
MTAAEYRIAREAVAASRNAGLSGQVDAETRQRMDMAACRACERAGVRISALRLQLYQEEQRRANYTRFLNAIAAGEIK